MSHVKVTKLVTYKMEFFKFSNPNWEWVIVFFSANQKLVAKLSKDHFLSTWFEVMSCMDMECRSSVGVLTPLACNVRVLYNDCF